MNHFHSLTVASVTRDTRDAVLVSFDVPDELAAAYAYQPGQHLTLRANIDGQDLRRSYSICSSVQDRRLRVGIKKVAGGQFSTWANEQIKPGMQLDVMPPMGAFHVPLAPDHRRHYLGFAAGSGITPLFSIIKTTLETEPHSRFTLVYGNRASSTVMLRDELADLKDRFLQRLSVVHVMSREKQDLDLFNGRIDGAKCEALCRQWVPVADIDMAFICGPEAMMLQVSSALQALGLGKEQIRAELFAAGTAQRTETRRVVAAGTVGECEVTLVIDGSHQSFTMARDSESVLDAGLAQGIDIRYACKGGICATCRCKVVEGKVDMDANHVLEDYEIARGFVLSCQAFPASDKLVLDFDQDG
jgi:ring-1,2-phenylacetyl-CoA epoxidase subunit PaaE